MKSRVVLYLAFAIYACALLRQIIDCWLRGNWHLGCMLEILMNLLTFGLCAAVSYGVCAFARSRGIFIFERVLAWLSLLGFTIAAIQVFFAATSDMLLTASGCLGVFAAINTIGIKRKL
jgi:hypothetical protein